MVELKKQDFDKNKELYEIIEEKLKKELGKEIFVEHVGSTAIPNMVGKNIIDVLIGAENKIQFEALKIVIEQMGYFPSKNSCSEIYQFFASRKEETHDGDIHIHLVEKGTKRFNDFIVLRDYLLANKDEAKAYADYKQYIINNFSNERKDYRKIKSEYVDKLIERANKNNNK